MRYDIADLVGLLLAGVAGWLMTGEGYGFIFGQLGFVGLDFIGRRAIDWYVARRAN